MLLQVTYVGVINSARERHNGTSKVSLSTALTYCFNITRRFYVVQALFLLPVWALF